MRSAGNDIVALALTDEDRTCRYRFYSRILTPGEGSLYDGLMAGSSSLRAMHGLSFSSFVWLLWSIKESAYKFVSRSNPRLVFAPLKFQVGDLKHHAGHFEGVVQFGVHLLYSRSFFIPGTAIHSVVSTEKDFCDVRWGVRATNDSTCSAQSENVRACALESLSRDLPGTRLRIVRSTDGPPEVWEDERPLDIPVSLAHHDKYVAWSYCFTANSSSYRKSAEN